MAQDKKMIYETPTIEVIEIELEQGIAGGSGLQVDEWQDNGSGEQNGDF
ncbi:hypothetical protein [Sphingobacterium arenae]|uniref:Lasso RiPP family leader peptide-containing protein n=1 Tax=Sphingobacterium arenae TaxID=1280598 RepID=A0ABR7Y7P2_9SPHI|nr:hypothetical protein [Sphingobacterium arenae]MBD1427304.1 hypothetical protein [Sphingobacterium arenae]